MVEKYWPKDKVASATATPVLQIGPPLADDEAAAIIQKNERGRQVWCAILLVF